jgi:sialic acid synthase SpsE
MSTIILDFGSGNTCKNDKDYIKVMYDQLKKVDSGKHNIIVKFQLFKFSGPNIPLKQEIFDYAFKYGLESGYKVTSSVFDMASLDFLINRYGDKIPFIKIANRRDLDWLMDYIPQSIDIIISKTESLFLPGIKNKIEEMWCISQYPAEFESYEKLSIKKGDNISDHTEDFSLFEKYCPKIVEWHYKLDYSTGLDSGSFARTPQMLSEIL